MHTELVELRGHIVDSLLLPKVLDEITARDGQFVIEELTVGKRRTDVSFARIRVEAADAALLDEILTHIQEHGAELVGADDAVLEPAPADGVFPDRFLVSSNHATQVRCGGAWVPVEGVRMDCGIVVEPDTCVARTARFAEVRRGDRVVVGHRGVRIAPLARDVHRADVFEFMGSEVSAEKPKALAIQDSWCSFQLDSARVGVNRHRTTHRDSGRRRPHACGSEPTLPSLGYNGRMLSPRVWG